jgi:hypothetical protein
MSWPATSIFKDTLINLNIDSWKDEKGWFSRILKFLLTGLIPIVSLMLFVWKMFQDQESKD